MEEFKVFPQKIVDTKTIVLKPRLDSNMVKLRGEALKKSLFAKFGFWGSRTADVTLVALARYYEPYVIIGGIYSIDYCKRHDYAIEVEDETREVFINGKKLSAEPLAQGKTGRVIRLVGEEHSNYRTETYVVLDRLLQEVSPEKLLLSPFEYECENDQNSEFDFVKGSVRLGEEIDVLRSRIVRRPADVAEVIKETFEISDRAIVYKPVYELVFYNAKNGKKTIVSMDGVTGETISLGKIEHSHKVPAEPSSDMRFHDLTVSHIQHSPGGESQFNAQESFVNVGVITEEHVQDSGGKGAFEGLTTTIGSDSVSQLNPENATFLAINFVKSLGHGGKLEPTRLSRSGEDYLVEISSDRGTAKVQIDGKSRSIKEYEILEG
jgi:hypothetical protein